MTEGSDNRGTELVDTPIEEVIDIQWLPDGSGFLFTKIDNFRASANVYHYDFATSNATKLTQFTSEYAIDISPSPDGQWIAFERATTLTLTQGDLWVMKRDGTEQRLLYPLRQPPYQTRHLPPPPLHQWLHAQRKGIYPWCNDKSLVYNREPLILSANHGSFNL